MHQRLSSTVPRALGVALALLCGSSMAASNAGPDQRLQTKQWAANCAACHGTDGRAVQALPCPVWPACQLPRWWSSCKLLKTANGLRP